MGERGGVRIGREGQVERGKGEGEDKTNLPREERDVVDDGRLNDFLAGEDGPGDGVDVGRMHVGQPVALNGKERESTVS